LRAQDEHRVLSIEGIPQLVESQCRLRGSLPSGCPDAPLLEWITQHKPDMVFSGHVHQSPFVNNGSWADRIGATWIFNAGHQYGAPPAYIVLDTTVGEAVWISAMGVQTVRLDAPLLRPIPPAGALPEWFGARTSTAGPGARDMVSFKPDRDRDRTPGGNPVPAGG
jgi:hypothetical protein